MSCPASAAPILPVLMVAALMSGWRPAYFATLGIGLVLVLAQDRVTTRTWLEARHAPFPGDANRTI